MIINVSESLSNYIQIVENKVTNQKSLSATKSFKVGDVISKFIVANATTFPTYLTIQRNVNEHITLDPFFLQYTNHSCNPNVFFDITNLEYLAIKDIKIGDELMFFYPSSEWNMTQSFECNCGSKNCLQTIKGAAHISKEILANYRLTDFIQLMIDKQ